MQFNKCKTCLADNGRAGNLTTSLSIGAVGECGNCFDTRKTGKIVIHTNLPRTEAELKRTMDILNVKAPVISYKIDVDLKDGTIYNQKIRIPRMTFIKLKNDIDQEIKDKYPNKDKYVNTPGYEVYLQPLVDGGDICFLNHTQRRFIDNALGLKLNYKHNSYLKIDK